MLKFRPLPPYPRFQFRPEKAAEAISLIARRHPGMTQYFVGKLLYLADKAHFLDWGRPITFDRYVAMVHGPVPSAVRNMLIAAAGMNAGMDEERLESAREHAAHLMHRVDVKIAVGLNGERQTVFERDASEPFQSLSKSDVQSIEEALFAEGNSSFDSLRSKTHKDAAWQEAWSRANGRVADIDVTLWADETDRKAYLTQLQEYGAEV